MTKILVLLFVISFVSIFFINGCNNEPGLDEIYCTKNGTSMNMSLLDAKIILANSECGMNNRIFRMTEASCNNITGTWWIDLDINRTGCNPACVIDVTTKKAEINWRCTGLRV